MSNRGASGDPLAWDWYVGDVVRKMRMAVGWTQKDLAKRAGVHHGTIVRLEEGDEGIQERTLKQITAALGVTVYDLWRLVPSLPGTHQTLEIGLASHVLPRRRSDDITTVHALPREPEQPKPVNGAPVDEVPVKDLKKPEQ